MTSGKLLKQEGICVGVIAKERKQVVEILSALQQKCGAAEDYRAIMNTVLDYERLVGSAIGAGVAIAQIEEKSVKYPSISAVTLRKGVDYKAPDSFPVRLAFLIILPPENTADLSSRLSVLLMDEDLRERLIDAADEETFLSFLCAAEEGRPADYRELPLILAVIDGKNENARKAAAMLQQTAEKQGAFLRVEFYEKGKNEDLFLPEELQEAQGVLLMCGMRPDRFDGKPLLRAGVTDGLYRPEYLLKNVTKAPVFRKSIVKKGRRLFGKIRFFRSKNH